MANRRVRLVRNVKLNGKPTFVAPVVTPKGVISSEMVLYKGLHYAFSFLVLIEWHDLHNPCRLLLSQKSPPRATQMRAGTT